MWTVMKKKSKSYEWYLYGFLAVFAAIIMGVAMVYEQFDRNVSLVDAFPVACVICLVLVVMIFVLRSPFECPVFVHTFDVSGRRNVDMESEIERYLLDNDLTDILRFERKFDDWKTESEARVARSLLKGYRQHQYEAAIDTKPLKFRLVRKQTRYRQHNYVKTPYAVETVAESFACDSTWVRAKYSELEAIGFECTTKEYHMKNQRKLATRELRERVMRRDNYTCQVCGKYMPDEVGLQIDHIVPVSKGGKTVLSNLRVTCDKCNRRKGAKIVEFGVE